MANDKNYAKVIFDGETIMDVTDTTATQDKVFMGETFHDATGALKIGTYKSGDGTVTSVAAGNGLKTDQAGNAPITTEGTISIDTDQVQEKLKSGSNIKTINNQTLLGEGNITIDSKEYEHPTYSTHPSGLYKITVDDIGSVSNAVAVTKEDITGLGIQKELISGTDIKTINNQSLLGPGNIEIGSEGTSDYNQLNNRPQIEGITLTGNKTLSDLGIQASETGKGLSTNDYTTADKNKLAGIADKAEVNQNAFSNIAVGSTTIVADSKTDTVTLVADNNITLTSDPINDKITIAAKDTTYEPATTSIDGLMSSSDKSKLDGIAENATAVDENTVSDWGFTRNAGTITEIKMNGASKGTSGVVDLGPVLTKHQSASDVNGTNIGSATKGVYINDSGKPTAMSYALEMNVQKNLSDQDTFLRHDGSWAVPSGTGGGTVTTTGTMISGNVVISDGGTVIKDSGYTIAKSVPANAVFTDNNQTIKGNGTAFNANGAIDIVAGNNITLTPDSINNKITIEAKDTEYTLPVATSSILGGVKSGTDITVDSDGNVSVNDDSHNHIISNVDGLQTALDGKAPIIHDHNYIPTSQKGAANGVAELDNNGKVPQSQLPSYVDDVIEGYYYNKRFYKEYSHVTEIPGETGKIYIDLSADKTYRWSGSVFVLISESLALGETSSTAYRGDRGKIAYDHSQSTHAPVNAEVNQNAFSYIAVGDKTITADSKTDTVTLVAGNNIILTPDTTNDKITIETTATDVDEQTVAEWGFTKNKGNVVSEYMDPEYIVISKGSNSIIDSNKKLSDFAEADHDHDLTKLGAISYLQDQSARITDNQKTIARNNIGAGTSNFDGDYLKLTNQPTIPSKTSELENDSKFLTKALTEIDVLDIGNVSVGSITDTSSFQIKEGNNITLATDPNNKRIIIEAKDTTYSTATTSENGLMSAKDKSKLNGIESGAEKNQNTFSDIVIGRTTISADAPTDVLTLVAGDNITLTPDPIDNNITISADTGSVYTLPVATPSILGGVKSGDSGSDFIVDPWNGTVSINNKIPISEKGEANGVAELDSNGKVPSSQLPGIASPLANGLMSSSDKIKLNGIEGGATAVYQQTVTDWGFTKNKGNVVTTGMQSDYIVISDGSYNIIDSDKKLSDFADVNHTHNNYIPTSQKGIANGVAELDSSGKVPPAQLPGYVDKIVEGYYYNNKFYKEPSHTTVIPGETGKLYVDLSTNKTYRWSGTTFVLISESLALGETSSTAYRGDRGKIAYDHSQSTHARTDATAVSSSTINGNIKINGTETTVYTHPSGPNPHGITKSDVGLGNVENKSSATIRGELTSGNVTSALGYTPYNSTNPDGYTTNTGTVTTKGTMTSGHVVISNGNEVIKDSGFTIAKSVPSDAKFTDTTYSTATTSANGLMSSSDKSKLDGIESGATQVNERSITNWGFTKNKGNVVTGAMDPGYIVVSTGSNDIIDSDKKLSDFADVNHTHNYIPTSQKGAASGVAELDNNGKVPSSQLPSYVDDVIEGYYYNDKFYKDYFHTVEIPGETGKIYVDLNTNKTYRWGGTAFTAISETLALGETSSTAYRGDRGKIAYDHSQSAHARTDATAVTASTTNGKIKINGTETTVYTHPTYTSHSSGLYKIATDSLGSVSSVASVSKADITALGIPAQDTTYSVATSGVNGLMSSNDKNKLDGIESGATAVNKNTVNGWGFTQAGNFDSGVDYNFIVASTTDNKTMVRSPKSLTDLNNIGSINIEGEYYTCQVNKEPVEGMITFITF